MCLDLQLDALLLALGAAASDVDAPDDTEQLRLPWRRWLEEDLGLALDLASATVSGQAALPASLARPGRTVDPTGALEDLAAHYRAMHRYLRGVLARSADYPDAARSRLFRMLGRCEDRIRELEG